MDLRQKVQAAKDAGYSDEEISQFLQKRGINASVSEVEPVQGYKKTTRGVSDVLKMLGLGAIPTIAGAGYEAVRAGKQRITGENQYVNEQGQPVENPFLSYEEMGKARTQPVEQIGRQTAGLAAYGIPFGGNIPRMALQGAGRFAGYTASQPESNLKDIAKAGVTGAVVEPGLGLLAKTIPKIFKPFKTVGEYRAGKIAEATGKTVSGDKIISALEKGAREVSPTAKMSYDRYLEQAKQMFKGRQLTVDEVIKLNQGANDAFTAAGRVGKASVAKFNKVLGDVLKSVLKITAPDVAKANELFKKLYGTQRALKTGIPKAAIGVTGGAAGYWLMNKLLGRQ